MGARYVPLAGSMRARALTYIEEIYGIYEGDLCGDCIAKPVVEARAMFVWIIRSYRPGVEYGTIGKWLGGRLGRTASELHLKAIRLRTENDDFDLDCIRFEGQMNQILGAPHASC